MMIGWPFSKPVSENGPESQTLVKRNGDRLVADPDAYMVHLLNTDHVFSAPDP